MKVFITIIEIVVQLFASWTIAYHVSLLVQLPAQLIVLPFLAIFLISLYLFYQDSVKALKDFNVLWPKQRTFLFGIFGFCLLLGSLTVFLSRPDYDDFSFFHRVLVQLRHLDQPFFLTDTGHNITGLPALSLTHVMTSYEPLVGLTANWLNIDPLWAYQNLAGFVVAALLPLVYFSLYRQLRLGQIAASIATIIAILFLFLDGNLHRSFGNFAFVRCWQGKAILAMLGVPIAILFCLRFLRCPSWRYFSLVAMVAISAVGLSGSGIFMIPFLIFAIALSYGFSDGNSWQRWKRIILLNLTVFYPVAIAIALKTGILPQPIDVAVWIEGWPATWWQNLQLVVGDLATLIRNLLILLLLPLIGLSRQNYRFLVGLSISLCLIFANPLLGSVWLNIVQPGAYWRLAYLFPLPLCTGLIASPLIWRTQKIRAQKLPLHKLRIGLATIVALAIVHAYQFSVFSSENASIRWKTVAEYKLPEPELTFARTISDQVSNRQFLASESIVVALGLINPTVRFEATRPVETLHLLRNFRQPAEGEARVLAQQTTMTCKPTKQFWQSLEDVNALILGKCPPEALTSLSNQLTTEPQTWKKVYQTPEYTLFLRETNRYAQR